MRSLEHLWHELRLHQSSPAILSRQPTASSSSSVSFEDFKAIPGVRVILQDVLSSTMNSTASLPTSAYYPSHDSEWDHEGESQSILSLESLASWTSVFKSTMDLLRGLGLAPREQEQEQEQEQHVGEMEMMVDSSDANDLAEPSSPWETTFMLESPSSSSSLSSTVSSAVDTLSSSIASSVSSASSFQSAVSELSKIVPLSSAAQNMDEDEVEDGIVFAESDIPASMPLPEDPVHSGSGPSHNDNLFEYDKWTPLFRCDRCSQPLIAASHVLAHICSNGVVISQRSGMDKAWSMSSFKLDQPLALRSDAVIEEMNDNAENGSGNRREAFEHEEDVLRISFGRGRDTKKGKGKQGYYGKYRSVSVVRESRVAYCQTCPSTVLLEGGDELVSLTDFEGSYFETQTRYTSVFAFCHS